VREYTATASRSRLVTSAAKFPSGEGERRGDSGKLGSPLFNYMINPDQIDELVRSHDEIMEVCKAAFEVIMSSKKHFKQLEVALAKRGVIPGFAERAEEIRKEIMHDRIIDICH
jgi:hypothetical protein